MTSSYNDTHLVNHKNSLFGIHRHLALEANSQGIQRCIHEVLTAFLAVHPTGHIANVEVVSEISTLLNVIGGTNCLQGNLLVEEAIGEGTLSNLQRIGSSQNIDERKFVVIACGFNFSRLSTVLVLQAYQIGILQCYSEGRSKFELHHIELLYIVAISGSKCKRCFRNDQIFLRYFREAEGGGHVFVENQTNSIVEYITVHEVPYAVLKIDTGVCVTIATQCTIETEQAESFLSTDILNDQTVRLYVALIFTVVGRECQSAVLIGSHTEHTNHQVVCIGSQTNSSIFVCHESFITF